MKIDPSTYHQLSVTKWTGQKSFKETNQTFCLDINSNCRDIIEVQDYEVIESRPLISKKKDSAQEFSLLSRELTHKEKMIRKRVAIIYQYYAYISFTNNRSRINIRI